MNDTVLNTQPLAPDNQTADSSKASLSSLAYNFLYAWQLVPEKSSFPVGSVPQSGTLTFSVHPSGQAVMVHQSWVAFDQQSYQSTFECVPDGQPHPFTHPTVADTLITERVGSHRLQMETYQEDKLIWRWEFDIQPNGYLKATHAAPDAKGVLQTFVQFYHKQLSVLPYAASVSGAVIRHTREGQIKHKALTAMEEQTQMQLDQIRQQIELLAQQAQAIQKRKDLSLLIYDAKLNFRPVIGHTYHLYQKHDDSYLLSMIGPSEWGMGGPFRNFVASVKLLADHTWTEVDS